MQVKGMDAFTNKCSNDWTYYQTNHTIVLSVCVRIFIKEHYTWLNLVVYFCWFYFCLAKHWLRTQNQTVMIKPSINSIWYNEGNIVKRNKPQVYQPIPTIAITSTHISYEFIWDKYFLGYVGYHWHVLLGLW